MMTETRRAELLGNTDAGRIALAKKGALSGTAAFADDEPGEMTRARRRELLGKTEAGRAALARIDKAAN